MESAAAIGGWRPRRTTPAEALARERRESTGRSGPGRRGAGATSSPKESLRYFHPNHASQRGPLRIALTADVAGSTVWLARPTTDRP